VSASRTVERASAQEKDALARTFVTLCEIESPTGRESPVADAIRAALGELGLEVYEDATMAQTGADCGNLLCRIPGPEGARTIMICAHMDTVPLVDAVEVECVDGVFKNRRNAILGADNKAAVAILIQLARRFAREQPPAGLELLLTTSEETGLRGASAFDVASLQAEFGYAFDHASPIGELILAAPSYYQVTAEFRGRPAHAGICPEDGRSAIVAAGRAIAQLELGRIDEQTTANIGTIEGGTATNVVAELCTVDAEVRSLDDSVAAARVQQMVDTFGWAASEVDLDVDTKVHQQFQAYRIEQSHPAVAVAAGALSDCGVDPIFRSTGGGSDANAFAAKGFSCLNMANGTEANHTPNEQVSVAALERMLDVALCLLGRAAEV